VKTDKVDARTLACFARERRPEAWEAPSKGVRVLQALVGRLDALMEMRQMETSRLAIAHAAVQASHRTVIEELGRQIESVRELIRQTVDDDPDLKRRKDLLETIPGLGERTIPQLLAYIGRPERFKSSKALAAYAGLVPWIRESGTSLNKYRGTHPMGHVQLRKCLYFPAMVAGRYNPVIARFWQQLTAQHKPGKVVVVACMHKLLAIVYGVLKSGQPFNPGRTSSATA
jgi:transposase